MSTDEPAPETPEPPKKVGIEFFGAQQQDLLDAKFARLKAAMMPAAAPEDDQKKDRMAKLFGDTSSLDIGTLVGVNLDELPLIDMPESRSARAAERTAEHLQVLVDEAIDSRDRAIKTERRETLMLRLTIAGVLLAAVAAVASIITIMIG